MLLCCSHSSFRILVLALESFWFSCHTSCNHWYINFFDRACCKIWWLSHLHLSHCLWNVKACSGIWCVLSLAHFSQSGSVSSTNDATNLALDLLHHLWLSKRGIRWEFIFVSKFEEALANSVIKLFLVDLLSVKSCKFLLFAKTPDFLWGLSNLTCSCICMIYTAVSYRCFVMK